MSLAAGNSSVNCRRRRPLELSAAIVAIVSTFRKMSTNRISLGLTGAFTTARSMRSLLFGIEPWDPLSQTTTIVALGLVAVAAAWIPTRGSHAGGSGDRAPNRVVESLTGGPIQLSD
jgi:hypothetical protein